MVLLKLKSIGVGHPDTIGRVCLSSAGFFNHRQRVIFGATSEWIPIILGVPRGSLLGPLLFILYTIDMFEMENRLYAYADDSTQLAVVFKQRDRPAVCSLP